MQYSIHLLQLFWVGLQSKALPAKHSPLKLVPNPQRFASRREEKALWCETHSASLSKAKLLKSFDHWSKLCCVVCCVLCVVCCVNTKQNKTKQNNTTKVVVDKNTTMTYLAYVNQPIKVHGVLSYHNYVSACAQRSQFHRTHLRDSLTIVTPFMRDTNYVSRDFAHRSLSSLYISQLLKLNTAYCKGY